MTAQTNIIEIVELEGEDQRLYHLTAHLVMNEHVLAYNLNYPFKTSPAYRWFIATKDGSTVGFFPVKLGSLVAVINNYYVAGDSAEVFDALMQSVVRSLGKAFEIESVVQTAHINHFRRNGFYTTTPFKNYTRMKASKYAKGRV